MMLRSLSKNISTKRLGAIQSKHYSTTPARMPSKRNTTGLQTAKPWKELTTPEKVVVASKTTVNVGVILTGVALTSAIVYYIGSELFGSQSGTNIFSDAVKRIHDNEQLVAMLGEPIKSHGEGGGKRRRNRRIMPQIVQDANQNEHLFMRFYVEGSLSQGTVMLEMIKDEKDKWQYKQLFVDVPGQGLPSKRIYLDTQ
ncbi:TIM21-domain-containing protein [Backusella circina FSU 941]|nr:TIM21-domain-containing protein [Backusella circina FSU 941]